MPTPLLKLTGHPLADVGVATLCGMAGKSDPGELTLTDLDKAGKEIKAAYTDSVFVAYLSCVYTMNAPYTNPTMSDESRDKAMKRLLSPHRSEPDEGLAGVRCVFSGEPATHLLERSQMPMLTGAGVMNFFPSGLSEMPVAAPYLLAIQALALGGRRSEGKLLIVHCDDPQWTLHFAKRYLDRNRLIIDLSRTNRLPSIDDPNNVLTREAPGGLNKEKRPKYPDAKAPQSLVMDDLVEVVAERSKGKLAESYTSVTVYLLSNSGQGPSLSIEHIPSEFLKFLLELHGTAMGSRWQKLVHRAWRQGKGAEVETEADAPAPKKSKKAAKPAAPSGAGRSKNELYNDLLAIFESGFIDWNAARRFVRRHLLFDPNRYYYDTRKTSDRPPPIEYELIDWQLTALFLERVLGMDKTRIELIKNFATRLAELIDEYNDKRLFRQLVFTGGEWQYRSILAKFHRQYTHDRNDLPFTFDDYINVFFTASPDERVSWSLIRDLISIRLVEVLHEKDFFKRPGNEDATTPPEGENSEPELAASN